MENETLLIVSNGFGHRSFASPTGRSTVLVRNGIPTKVSRKDWELVYENPINTKELQGAIESAKIEILHVVDNSWERVPNSYFKVNSESEKATLVESSKPSVKTSAKSSTKSTSKPSSSNSKLD